MNDEIETIICIEIQFSNVLHYSFDSAVYLSAHVSHAGKGSPQRNCFLIFNMNCQYLGHCTPGSAVSTKHRCTSK